MTQIYYTALRELTGSHSIGETVLIDIDIEPNSYGKTRTVTKDVPRAKGGARETLYHRADVTHTLTFVPVNGDLLSQMQEFLASTESGESFSLYLYGSESAPLTVVREDEGHTESLFMGPGSSSRDYYQASITVAEV